jgi:BirA family biotin operon repressor/biotin-[acetyl-CoA-carboxylase] ligase
LPNKNTLFVGKVLLEFPELSSTNQYALELIAKSNPSEGTVISTAHQSAGRGQIGSTWESEPGCNITMSVIFFPTFLLPQQQFNLTKAFSLAVRDFLAAHLPKSPAIKWPNDIYVGAEKITGILLQNAIGRGVIQSCIAGFGVNVNQTRFSPELPNPTSLKLQTGRAYHLPSLIQQLCEHLEFRYLQLKREDWSSLHEDYLCHLYGWQEIRTFQMPDGGRFRGRICGVDASGQLLIEREKGAVQAFSLKEIQFIHE